MKHRKSRSLILIVIQSAFITSRAKVRSFGIVLLTSLLSFSSLATEVNGINTDKYLLNSCNAFQTTTDNAKTLPCVMYIKGFFNGLLNAGNENVSLIDENIKEPSTLVERAYANRVGNLAQRKPLSHSCITVDELKELIIESLSNDSASTFLSVKQLNSLLMHTLTTACSSGKK
tara:strand:- start:8012 stop:8533 length:522 start_codon:yes stop_codon:yes gene_type:complete